ncbi:MAG TPA: FkbM family methyltransferase [Ignavibacteria bacterium]
MLITKAKNLLKMFSIFRFASLLKFYKLKYFTGKDSSVNYMKLKNGLKLSAIKSQGDLTTLFEIFIDEDYDFIGEKSEEINIMDIGANVGYFSMYISKRFPKSNIYSFEPFPNTFKRLTENIERNNITNIKPYQLAISDSNGTADFYAFEWAGCNTLINRGFSEGLYERIKVECRAFDDIFELTGVKNFKFAKIDCEGSEYQIFLNSSDSSIRSVKNYILEVHDGNEFTKEDLEKKFNSLGYKVDFAKGLLKARLV